LIVYLYQWFPNAVVSFNSHVSAALASGSASVDASGVRFLGGGDLLDGAQRLANVLEAAFAQQAGLIVNAEATRPQDGTVKLTLSLPSGFITDGFLNVCVEQGEIELSVANVFPLIATEGNLITINGQGFGDDTRDLRIGMKDEAGARFFPMEVLRATDTQILARMGPAPPDFTQGPIEVRRGEGFRLAPANPSDGGLHEVWRGGITAAATSDVGIESNGLYACAYSTLTHTGLLSYVWLTPNWVFPVEVSLNAEVHSWPPGTNSFATAVNKTIYLGTSGSTTQKVVQIANALEQAVAETGFTLNTTVWPASGGTNVLDIFQMWAAMSPGFTISFSVCVRSVPLEIEVAQVTTEGAFTKITGSGFGNEAEDLSVAILDGGGARLIPLDVLAASDTKITVRMGAVPPDAQPGPIMVTRGQGSFNLPQPFFDDVSISSAWTWLGRESGPVSTPVITPEPTQPEAGQRWFFSDPPSNGELCVVIDSVWPSNAVVSITAEIQDTNGSLSRVKVVRDAKRTFQELERDGEITKDMLEKSFWQMAAVAVDGKVTTLPGGDVKISLSLCDGEIARGFITIGVTDLPVIGSVQTASGGPGDLVTITGFGFGANPDELLVYVQGSNGVLTALQVLSATETQIVASVGIVRPDTQAGPIIVARGESFRLQKVVPGVTGLELQQFIPAGEVFAPSSQPFHPIPPPPSETNVCFFSTATNGVICVEVEGDWPPNVRVFLDFIFYPEGTPTGPIYTLPIHGYVDLPGGTAQQCAAALCAVFDGIESSQFPIGALHCVVTQTGPDRFKLTFSADVPISGLFNICYAKPNPLMLAVRLTNGDIEISWTGVGTLEEAADPAGPWQEVQPPPVRNLHVEPADAPAKFFRVRQ
jgi:hypothetical protein